MGSLLYSFSLLPGFSFRFVWFFWFLLRQFLAPKRIIALIAQTLILNKDQTYQQQIQQREKSKSYSWRFVGGTEGKQAVFSTDMFRFIQHLIHSFCNFFIDELDSGMSQWVINTASILAHQTGAPTKGQYAP